VERIEALHRQLEKLMYGHNYDVSFHFHLFTNCQNTTDFDKEIKANCSEFYDESNCVIIRDVNDFWDQINFALTFRGDEGAGLSLTQSEENELDIVQQEYRNFINGFISPETKILDCPTGQGIFWGYNLFLKNLDQSLHISAFADD